MKRVFEMSHRTFCVYIFECTDIFVLVKAFLDVVFVIISFCIYLIRIRRNCVFIKLSHYGCPYHIETSPLICRANKWTGFYMIGTSVTKDLN